MKRKLLYPMVFITASLSTAPALSVPLAPVPAVLTQRLGDDADRGESSPADALTDGRQTAVAEQKALLLDVRERGKRQAARAAFDLAALSVADNDQGRAAELLREAVALQPENTDYLIAASRMAFGLKDYKYAEACLVKVLATNRKTHVEDGTKLLDALDNLATLYRIQGRTAAAKSLVTEGLAAKTARYGEHHPRVIHSLYHLAELDLIAANYGEAKHHLSRVVSLLDASPSPIDDRDGGALLHNIGELYRVSGQYPEAESAFAKAMALWNRSPSTNQRGIAMTQAGLDRLRADRSATASLVGLEVEPQVKNALPVSSLPSESTQAQM